LEIKSLIAGRSKLLRILFWVGAALCIALASFFYFGDQRLRLPYRDDFASGRTDGWQAYGGTWETAQAGVRNNSDERGAKFITGSLSWTDYTIETDVMLLGREGDAGVIVRSSDEEEGVDAYSGYYVGLRDKDNTIVIGRADHGWMEYHIVSVETGIHPFQWYHLKVVALGCKIAALATDPTTGTSTPLVMYEESCARSGGIGLRSYSSGGVWRNVTVSKISPEDTKWAQSIEVSPGSPAVLQTEAGFNSRLLIHVPGKPMGLASQQQSKSSELLPLNSLRLLSEIDPPRVTVKGSVVLTAPELFVQDSTGGVAVEMVEGPSLKIGDEVEVAGTVEISRFCAFLRKASVRLLWSRSPAPPLSVTASQAASGSFDGVFVEIEGYLRDNAQVIGQSGVLDLKSGSQTFRAVVSGKRQDSAFAKLRVNSLLRLRGISVVDPKYTENLTPFVLLLRSGDDLEVISGPPWWDKRQLLAMGLVLLAAIFIGFWLYTRAEHWKLRAVIEERSRMAREIHDTLAQGFSGIALQLECALRELQARIDLRSGSLTMALQMARQSRAEAHRSIAALRTLHTEEPLANMLQKVMKQQIAGSGLQLNFAVSGNPQRFSEETQGQILRIAQESLANTIQHAQANRVDMNVSFDADQMLMEIVDDGRGFDVAYAPTAEEGHFGLQGMKERAACIQGAILSVSSGSNGTKISMKVPLTNGRHSGWRQLSELVSRFFRDSVAS
jgi:signal transduction histidine kinase